MTLSEEATVYCDYFVGPLWPPERLGRFHSCDRLPSWRFFWQVLTPEEEASGQYPNLAELIWFSIGPFDFNLERGAA